MLPVLPLFHGDYAGGEEPNEWLCQLDLNLPVSWNDTQKIDRFRRQCAPGSLAEMWFTTLTNAQTASWAYLEAAFVNRWPPNLLLQLTAGQKKERLKAVVLKEEDIGSMVEDEKGQEWGHVRWARQVQRLAQSFGDSNCQYLDVVLDGVPDILCDQLADSYTSWAAFLAGVNGVSINILNRAWLRAAEERTMRDDIAQLKARLQSQQQVQQTRPYLPSPPAYRPFLCQAGSIPLIPTTSGQPQTSQQATGQPGMNLVPPQQYQVPAYLPQPAVPSYQQPPVTPGPNPFAGAGNMLSTNLFYRYQQPPQTPSCSNTTDRIHLATQYATLTHHPDMEMGRAAYTQQVKEWHDKYGADAMPTLHRPYPLKPGSALLGSRECFTCGMVTAPPHQSISCTNAPAVPQETRWREIVSSMVGRAVWAQSNVATQSTAVQYVATAPAPYYDPMEQYTTYPGMYTELQYEFPGNGTGLQQ